MAPRTASGSLIAVVALAVIGLLVALLVGLGRSTQAPPSVAASPTPPDQAATRQLTVYCAAGLKNPVEKLANEYRARYGVQMNIQYEGSGTLLGKLTVSPNGDLFIAADGDTMRIAREKGVVKETIPLVVQQPVIAVAAGNPKGIATLADLLRADVKLGLANPEQAAVSKVARAALSASTSTKAPAADPPQAAPAGRWEALRAAAVVLKPTVMELATDLRVGALDAAIVWDSTVKQVDGLVAISAPEFAATREQALAGIIAGTAHPAAALHAARFLAAPETGNPVFAACGFAPVAGDAWSERPEMTFFSGSVNRTAIASALRKFEEREGATITTTYNGCGILCAQMKTMVKQGAPAPDAYYACDVCFVGPVADLYSQVTLMTETGICIAVPKGNARNLRGLVDLAQPGLRLGVCNAEQSTLGYMTKRMLEGVGLAKSLRANVVAETPTGDLLVQQLRSGALDAAIVYDVNVKTQAEHIDRIAINNPNAKATQPFAVADKSTRRQLGQRLLDHLREHRVGFEDAGFRWIGEDKSVPSTTFSGVSFVVQP